MLHDVVVVWPGSYNNVAPGHAHYFDFQLATCRNTLQQRGQTRATCCAQQCCDLLCSNVAIVWPVHANAGPTKLGYVALRCCDRLAGAFNSFGANALSIISALLIKKEILMNIKFARADWLIFIINKSIVFKWAHISQNPGISSLTDASCLVVDDPFTV